MSIDAAALVLFVLLAAACRPPPVQLEARRGDFAAVRETLKQPRDTDVERLAFEVLAYEIRSAEGIEDRAFIASLRPCATNMDRVLGKRTKTRDALGGQAALLLFDIGRYGGPRPKRFRSSDEGSWRALAARATASDQPQRLAYFVDDDERVRQAALEAAVEAQDERDLPALLEVSRLDPSPYIRSRALYALGQLGGLRVHRALLDRLAAPTDDLRLAALDALSQPGVGAVDDYASLVRIVDDHQGLLALHAAYLLTQLQHRPEVKDKATLVATGVARLLAFADGGSEEEQRMALRLLPTNDPRTEVALQAATKHANPEVRVIAWARLLGRPKWRSAAESALLTLAKEQDRVAYQARSALAAGGSGAVLPYFNEQAKSPHIELRLLAGQAFIRLGRDQELAPLLADPSERIRRTLACGRLAR